MFFSRAPRVNSVSSGNDEGEVAMRQLGSSIRRRSLLKTGAAATGFAAASLLPAGGFAQAKTQTVNLQLGWLAGNNQIGEVAAKHLGYFEEEKLNVVIHPGHRQGPPERADEEARHRREGRRDRDHRL